MRRPGPTTTAASSAERTSPSTEPADRKVRGLYPLNDAHDALVLHMPDRTRSNRVRPPLARHPFDMQPHPQQERPHESTSQPRQMPTMRIDTMRAASATTTAPRTSRSYARPAIEGQDPASRTSDAVTTTTSRGCFVAEAVEEGEMPIVVRRRSSAVGACRQWPDQKRVCFGGAWLVAFGSVEVKG